MLCQASIGSGENKRNQLREFLTEGLFPLNKAPQGPAVPESEADDQPGKQEIHSSASADHPPRGDRKTLADGDNRSQSCGYVAALLAYHGFSYCKNHRGQCYFCKKIMWKGECVNCCLGRPELSAPIDDPNSSLWVGYYGTDESGDMLYDEMSPSVIEFLKRNFTGLLTSSLQPKTAPSFGKVPRIS